MSQGRNAESGSVLILALLVTLLILGVGVTAMYLSSSGMKVSTNINRRQEALTAAETGLERALDILNTNRTFWDRMLQGQDITGSACPGSPSHDPVVTGSEKGYVLCDSSTIPPTPLEDISVLENSSSTLAAAGGMRNLSYTVFIKNDPVEANVSGSSWIDDNDFRVQVRVEGIGRDGLSFFAIESIVTVPSVIAAGDDYKDPQGSTLSKTRIAY